MNRSLLLAGLCTVLLTACSSIATDYDFDDQADFSKYRTFQWAPASAKTAADPMQFSEIQDRRIRDAVELALGGDGITLAASNPDLLVAYSTRTNQKTQVVDSGYNAYGYGYRGWRGDYWRPSTIDVYQYQEGTLIVDLIDAKAKRLVWRGKATGVVGDYADADKLINEAVTEMFVNYPPKK